MENDYRYTPAGIRRFNNKELYLKTVEFQKLLADNDIAWHNPFSDECTIDFCCCMGNGKYDTYFPSYETAFKDTIDSPETRQIIQQELNNLLPAQANKLTDIIVAKLKKIF